MLSMAVGGITEPDRTTEGKFLLYWPCPFDQYSILRLLDSNEPKSAERRRGESGLGFIRRGSWNRSYIGLSSSDVFLHKQDRHIKQVTMITEYI